MFCSYSKIPMRSALIEQPRPFIDLCLLPSELPIIVELIMAATA